MKTALFLIFAAQAGNGGLPVENSTPHAPAKQTLAEQVNKFQKAVDARLNSKAADDPRAAERALLKLRKMNGGFEAKQKALQAAWDMRGKC